MQTKQRKSAKSHLQSRRLPTINTAATTKRRAFLLQVDLLTANILDLQLKLVGGTRGKLAGFAFSLFLVSPSKTYRGCKMMI